MTTPTMNGTRYPQPVEDLLPAARALELPEGKKLPSRNRLMREFRIGAPKADALRALLMNEGIRRDLDQAERDGRLTRPGADTRFGEPVPVAFDHPEPIGPEPADDRTEQARIYNLIRGGTGGASVDVTEAARRVADNLEATEYVRSVARSLVDAAPDTRAQVSTDHTPNPAGPPPAVEPTEPTEQVTPVGHPDTKIPEHKPPRRVTGRGWAYVGVILGGVVSIAANVAHTYLPKPPPNGPAGWVPDPNWSPSPLAVAFSVFWPVALFVAVEILTRVPWGDGARWVWARVIGVLPVALVAAVVSYRHLSGLLAHFGEDPLTVAIGPLAIDGLMVMASAALLATGLRARK